MKQYIWNHETEYQILQCGCIEQLNFPILDQNLHLLTSFLLYFEKYLIDTMLKV